MARQLEIGRLLRSDSSGFVVGMRFAEWETLAFGALLRAPLAGGSEAYGLIYDIRIEDDGLVRQLITADDVDESILADNRLNRSTPIEVSVLMVGHLQAGEIRHLLPPRPPFSLESIHLCSDDELRAFTAAGRFGYFRHILRAANLPVGELLAAHLEQAARVHDRIGDPEWIGEASKELIVLLRDDYDTLMSVLLTLGDANIG